MTYTHLTLILLGFLGVLLHSLVELNKINKASLEGELKLKIGRYFKSEVFSLIISLIVVIVCVIASQEIKQIQQVGNYLALAFVAIGYMGQSILVAIMGKAQKTIEDKIDNKPNQPPTI